MALRIVTQPADEPLTLAEAKAHLRQTSADDDDLISALIIAARTAVEDITKRSLITQTLELTRDYCEPPSLVAGTPVTVFRPTVIYLPRPPLQSVLSVTYLDGEGNTVTLHDTTGSPQIDSAIVVDTKSQPGRIVPVLNGSWPSTLDQINAVTIQYKAGYGDDGQDVPGPILAAIKLVLGHLYEHPEAVSEQVNLAELPMGVQFLLSRYMVMLDEIA